MVRMLLLSLSFCLLCPYSSDASVRMSSILRPIKSVTAKVCMSPLVTRNDHKKRSIFVSDWCPDNECLHGGCTVWPDEYQFCSGICCAQRCSRCAADYCECDDE
jgi:hypothetical protein